MTTLRPLPRFLLAGALITALAGLAVLPRVAFADTSSDLNRAKDDLRSAQAAFKQATARKGARVVALEKYGLDSSQIGNSARLVATAAARGADAVFIPDGAEAVRVGRGLTGVTAAALAKLCDVHELVLLARRIVNPTRARTLLGARGTLSSRLQPNHPTDDTRPAGRRHGQPGHALGGRRRGPVAAAPERWQILLRLPRRCGPQHGRRGSALSGLRALRRPRDDRGTGWRCRMRERGRRTHAFTVQSVVGVDTQAST